ncbi:helix-turn-helix transcriptional regulator [Marinihelvus fidelis]|uniref:Helix-turn-helix transcriptional regulator n=1 Tax=Marinihelvus fidelis TaxID=2613842 RepID=A0A5N0THM4_9GAMM|nr:helix-turn-helix transcriptional regulator [Marinihelvus fidelis]KAA9134091.1 helix-turn-helix transcriptional regulator [Marinihelvus fidelis]
MKIQNLTPTENVLAELGHRLARARKAQGMTQPDLAQAAGIGVATLRRIEGGSDGQMGSWIKLLRTLGMIDAVDGLLAQEIRSPMADAKAAGNRSRARRRPADDTAGPWGDQAP